MNLTIIGLCGAAGSGKDAVAEILIQEFGFTKRSFAEELRREVSLALTNDVYRWDNWSGLPEVVQDALLTCLAVGDLDPWRKPTSTDMRVLLQTWGTEFRRAQSPGYWVTREAATLPKSGRFVYTDVRFPNEESFIRRLGSLYRVSRGGVEGNGHVSEAFYRQFPVAAEIRNDGTLEELRAAVLSTITLAGVAA